MEPDPMGFCDDLFPQESSWDSSYLFTAMSQILIEEVMGYHTTTNHEAGGMQIKAGLSRGKTWFFRIKTYFRGMRFFSFPSHIIDLIDCQFSPCNRRKSHIFFMFTGFFTTN